MQLNKILKGFEKTIKQLEIFIDKQDIAIASVKEERVLLDSKEIELQDDRTKAVNAKRNIEGIIS